MTGNYLKNRIKGFGVPLKDVADGLNITPQDLQSKLKTKDVKVELLFEIAQVINKSVYDLLPSDLKSGLKDAHTPGSTLINEPLVSYNVPIPHYPQREFVTESVTNSSRKGLKSGKNQTSEKCEKCVEKDRIIEANLTTIKQMEGRLADKDQIIRAKEELIEALRHENSRLSQDSGKEQRNVS